MQHMQMTMEQDLDAQAFYIKRATEEKRKFESVFDLAGIEILNTWELVNPYWPPSPRYHNVRTPWYLFQTPYGLIRIGWRKNVINIDWEETAIRKEATAEEVTKSLTNVHAWSYIKATEYLQNLIKGEKVSADLLKKECGDEYNRRA